MRIRFYNARILTMEPGKEIFSGELHVEDDHITYVGTADSSATDCAKTNGRSAKTDSDATGNNPTDCAAVGGSNAVAEKAWDREIDCEGNLLMPGFKNAHTHSAMTFLRSFADDLPLQEWLYNRVFPMEAKLT